jgi:hypothetical protein
MVSPPLLHAVTFAAVTEPTGPLTVLVIVLGSSIDSSISHSTVPKPPAKFTLLQVALDVVMEWDKFLADADATSVPRSIVAAKTVRTSLGYLIMEFSDSVREGGATMTRSGAHTGISW